ncbi:lysosome-associated membrane glycoprotein 3 [Paramormyrops kingsleyae]|uniref:lysosome-associated membrane glycoprotein 3 n=1 Tax=Paramormyrops kingsleyae TaxID=1676925 RepID=UPI000CD655E0|nr:lysosome-associated membrane glycoprotein 3-like [Paramormyrops kingsleyae]
MTNSIPKIKRYEASLMWMLLLLGSWSVTLKAPTEAVSETVLVNSTLNQLSSSKKPVLLPKESIPPTGDYSLHDQKGNVCIKALLGAEYIVTQGKTNLYFNLDPKSTMATGFCGDNTALLSLNFDGGSIEFTFVKKGKMSYVSILRANLTASRNCINCRSETFAGALINMKLFLSENGRSHKCYSEDTLTMANNLNIKIMNMKIQGFQISSGKFGKENECWPDFIKRIVPIILGGTAVGLGLIVVLAWLLARERRAQGYQRI